MTARPAFKVNYRLGRIGRFALKHQNRNFKCFAIGTLGVNFGYGYIATLDSLVEGLARRECEGAGSWLLRCNGTEIYASRTSVLIPIPTACFKGAEAP